MRNIVEMAKSEFFRNMPHDGTFVDLNLGSGYEALDMALYATEGRVFGFGTKRDIECASKLMEAKERDNVRLICDNPAQLDVYLSTAVDGVLCRVPEDCPFSGKELLKAVETACVLLKSGGRLALINHKKHDPALGEYLCALSYRTFLTMRFNGGNDAAAPEIVLMEKR